MSKQTISIKIASDVVCPWCYIGKKEMEKAMETLKDEFHFEVQYLPFELSPDMPLEGADFKTHITEKYGNWEQFISRAVHVEERGKAVGIKFDIAAIGPSPNTFQMHRIIQFAYQFGLQAKVKEAYMSAYFEKLIDLTKIENVIAIAVEQGMDEDLITQLLNGTEGVEGIHALQDNVRAMGITGVPFFIINDQYGISGAQPAHELIHQLHQLKQG